MLLVGEDNLSRFSEKRNLAQHVVAARAMLPHHVLFFRRESSRLAQDFVGNCHFADVVQEGAAGDDLDLRRADSHGAGQSDGVRGYTLGMPFGLGIFQIQGVAQRLQRHVVGVFQVFHRLAQHLGASAHDLLQVLLIVVAILKGLTMVQCALHGVDQQGNAVAVLHHNVGQDQVKGVAFQNIEAFASAGSQLHVVPLAFKRGADHGAHMGFVIHYENARGAALAAHKARFRLRAGTSRERHRLRSCQVQCQGPVLQDLRPAVIRPYTHILREQLFAGRYSNAQYPDPNKSAPSQPKHCSSLHGIRRKPKCPRSRKVILVLEAIAQAVAGFLGSFHFPEGTGTRKMQIKQEKNDTFRARGTWETCRPFNTGSAVLLLIESP